ncbi:MAG TPA: cupin domain-containing protein [Micropepsaceae bacterium]|nr:cupin domain-containing protein [Micropepsaceae bacterium]
MMRRGNPLEMAGPLTESNQDYEAAKRAWAEAQVSPLWESAVAFKEQAASPKALHWRWNKMRPLIDRAITLVSPKDVERRVLLLSDPELSAGRRATTTRGLNAGLKILLPGESARPHRHSMDAIRFVLEGEGATTIVDGKTCPMQENDLVLTPGWSWHEHVHHGSRPVIWLDGLNSPLHRYLGTAAFEPGPPRELVPSLPDAAFETANILPEMGGATPYSPVFRYSYESAAVVAAAAPKGKDGTRRARYVNPATGGPAIMLMDHQLVQLDSGVTTLPFRTTANTICAVVEGEGSSTIGAETLAWEPKDVFTIPTGNWTVHRASAKTARLFVFSDREVFARLGLLKEEYGNAG